MKKYYKQSKTETNSLLKLEIYWLKSKGYLNNYKKGGIDWLGGRFSPKQSIGIEAFTIDNDNSFIRLFYAKILDGEKTQFDYRIKLEISPCNYGGKRYWFICPLVHNGIPCKRKVAVLYKEGDYFGCRHCQNLTYSSRNENRRCKHYNLFKTVTIGDKIRELKLACKRKSYAGLPTKSQKRIRRLFDKIRPP
jgi:hypothetical protein